MALQNTVSGPEAGNAGKADALSQAFDAAIGDIAPDDNSFAKGVFDPEPIEPVEDSTTEDAPLDSAPALNETAEEKAQRLRDEKGRFAREAEATKTAAKPATPAMSPPAHWDAATRDAFGKLPAEAQKLLLERSKHLEAGFTRKSTELAEDRKFAQSVKSLIRDDHREQLRQVGMNEVDGINHLLKLNDYATKDPAGYVRWVMTQARIDPRQAFPEYFAAGQDGQAYQPPQIDPQLQQLQATVQTLQQREAARERYQQQQAATEYEGRLASAGDVIAKFRDATDEAGSPAHPYFDQVKEVIAQLCASHPTIKNIPDISDRLAQAYETAIYAEPSLRKNVMDSELARAKAEQRKQQDVEKARRASPAIKPNAPTSGLRNKPKTLTDALRGAMGGISA